MPRPERSWRTASRAPITIEANIGIGSAWATQPLCAFRQPLERTCRETMVFFRDSEHRLLALGIGHLARQFARFFCARMPMLRVVVE
jgi:hypothetical protein